MCGVHHFRLPLFSVSLISDFLNLKRFCSFCTIVEGFSNLKNHLQFQVTSRRILYSICIQNHLNSICIDINMYTLIFI